jgi:hypothetical protein
MPVRPVCCKRRIGKSDLAGSRHGTLGCLWKWRESKLVVAVPHVPDAYSGGSRQLRHNSPIRQERLGSHVPAMRCNIDLDAPQCTLDALDNTWVQAAFKVLQPYSIEDPAATIPSISLVLWSIMATHFPMLSTPQHHSTPAIPWAASQVTGRAISPR